MTATDTATCKSLHRELQTARGRLARAENAENALTANAPLRAKAAAHERTRLHREALEDLEAAI